MAVPVSNVHYLRFFLHAETDGILMAKKRKAVRSSGVPNIKEIRQILDLLAKHGVQKIRLVGDDPADRGDLLELVDLFSSQEGIFEVGLTTGGYGLTGKIEALAENGLKSINFNVDTLRRNRFKKLTGQTVKQFDQLWAAVDESVATGLKTKLNVVLRRGQNHDEIPEYVNMTKKRRVHVRFIEWNSHSNTIAPPSNFISSRETMAAIKPPMMPQRPSLLDGPALVYDIPKHAGTIGFIPNITEHFCSSCNRIGITDQGEITSCIFGHGLDLVKHLRSPKGAESVSSFIERVLRRKSSLSAKLSGFSSPSKPADTPAQVPVLT